MGDWFQDPLQIPNSVDGCLGPLNVVCGQKPMHMVPYTLNHHWIIYNT